MATKTNYQYRTLVSLKTGCVTRKEWIYSVSPVNEGDYIELPLYNIKEKKRTKAICKVLKIWIIERTSTNEKVYRF